MSECKRRILAVTLAIVLVAGSVGLSSASGAQAPDPQFIIARQRNLGKLQTQLQQAADRGYRVVPIRDGGSGALLEKADGTPPIEYLLIDATAAKKLEEELGKAADAGYRLVYVQGGLRVLMERSKGASARTHEYRVLATDLRQTMEDELRGPALVGFRVVGQSYSYRPGLRTDDEFVAILERPIAPDARTRMSYVFAATRKASTREREMQDAADRGYRLTPTLGHWEDVALLEKAADEVKPVVDYRVLSAGRGPTMQKEMDEASAAGFHFAAVLGGGAGNFETAIAMERPRGTSTRTHEQRLLRWRSVPVTVLQARSAGSERELFAAMTMGFRLVGQAAISSAADQFFPAGGGWYVILERRLP